MLKTFPYILFNTICFSFMQFIRELQQKNFFPFMLMTNKCISSLDYEITNKADTNGNGNLV